MKKAIKFGEQQGSILTLMMVFFGGLFTWVCIQAATTIVTVMFVGLFITIFGGFFMETTGSFANKFIKTLFKITDTKNRVHAMEEYHEIKYRVIPEKRLYTKLNETCELIVKKVAI